MKKSLVILSAVMFIAVACSGGGEQPQELTKKPMTNREKAERVGKFGDRTLTHNLEKQLTGALDSADEHQQELEEAAGE